jgi:hypothetical protein
MTGKVSKRPVGRPPKSGSPYQQLSKAMATVFDKTVDKIGGADEIANLLVIEMRDNGKVLDVLKVVQTYLPRQHNVDLGVSASDSLSDALRGVADRLASDKADKAKQAEIIDGDFTESD